MNSKNFKKVMLVAILLQITCMMCACGQVAEKSQDSSDPNETIYQVAQEKETTYEVEEVPEPPEIQEVPEVQEIQEVTDYEETSQIPEEEVLYFILEAGEQTIVDLDGDGHEEIVSYDLWEEPEYGDIFQATIRVDGEEIQSGYGYFDTQLLMVGFTSDSSVYLLLSDYGMSDDYATNYYKYEGGSIICIGSTQGLIFNDTLKIYPDKTIIADTRAGIVQTWWYQKPFILGDRYIEEIEQDFYDIAPCDFFVFASETLCDYDFYTQPDVTGTRVTVPRGAYVTFTRTDDVNWTEIIYEQDNEVKVAYFYVEGFWSLDGDPNFTCDMLFKDLLLAD